MTSSPPSHRILIVDDNPAIHEDFRKILSSAHARNAALERAESVLFDQPIAPQVAARFQLDSAFQGNEALDKVCASLAEGEQYALAFVDIRMPPGWDGIETIERLWEIDPALQCVICTAYSDYSWEKMSTRLGVNDNLVILKKPFDNIEVLQLAHALTRKWTVTQQAQLQVERLDEVIHERTAELRRSEERFSTAFRASPVALVIQTLEDDRFIDVNDTFVALVGGERSGYLGRTPIELGLAIDYKETSERPARNCPAKITTADGELREVLISTARLSLSGQPHVLMMIEDISERLRLESQLRQAQKMEAVGQLAAGVAHDFNNLLTIIEGHASLQLANLDHTRDTIESLTQIETAAEKAADLTRQLLAFSRRQIMRPRPISLNKLVEGLLSMLRRVLGERISIQCDLQPGLPLILADQTSVEQVVMNLTLNARDAMPTGGTITFRTEREEVPENSTQMEPEVKPGEYVCLAITDTGTGMDESTRARIFEPFFTTKEVNKGTGMGLATVYGIARQHDGWIDVKTTPGDGSTFCVYFPATEKAQECEVQRTVQPAVSVKPGPAGAHRILTVEDDASVRCLVKEILEHHGYIVLEAETGDAALAMWPDIRDTVDLVLTDMVMPGEHNGLEFARKLIADKPDVKIIYTSGYSSELFASDLELIEGQNYLPKPYLTATLIGILRQALDAQLV
jgi:PAS domain S-box-containing protein